MQKKSKPVKKSASVPDLNVSTQAVTKKPLRQHAKKQPPEEALPSAAQTQRLLHELRVNQIELTAQNEELKRALADLETQRARCHDFYDLAPTGYITLDKKGLILDANRAAAALLGVTPDALTGKPISRFMIKKDRADNDLRLKKLFEAASARGEQHGKTRSCELQMVKKDKTAFWARMEAVASNEGGTPFCRMVLSDITGQKFREKEHEVTLLLIASINTQDDLRKCMSELTATLQGWSGCEAVGIRLRDGEDYPYFETRGFEPGFVELETLLCAYGPDGKILRDGEGNPLLECMCGNVLSGRFDPDKPFFTPQGSFWTNSTTALLASSTEADRQARTRNRCNGEGYESVALIPLCIGQRIFGLLQFNDRRPDRFTADLIAQFERMAGTLAMALSHREIEETLQKSEENYRTVADYTYDWEYWIDPAGSMVYVSPSCERVSGWRPGELQADPDLLVGMVHPDDRRKMADHQRDLQSDEDCQIEYRILARDGTTRWISHRCQAVYGTQGQPLGRRASNRDITERKLAEESLQKNRQRLDEAYQLAHIGAWTWNAETDTITWTEELYRIAGLDPLAPAPAPREHKGYFAPESWRALRQAVRRTIKTGEPYQLELQLILPDGAIRWISTLGSAIYDKQRRLTGLQGTLQDITGRKQGEDALRTSEAKLRVLISGLPDIVMRFDRDGRHLFVSENVSRVVNIQANDFIGKTHHELGFPEENCRLWEETIRRVFDTGQPFETEYTFESLQGPATHNWRIVPERDEQGLVTSVLSISRDITAHRKAERDYSTLFNEMLEGFALHEILLDEQGRPADYRFLAVNPAFERMTGIKAEGLTGRTVLEAIPDIGLYWIEIYGKVALTGEPAFFERYNDPLKKHFSVTAFRPAPGQFACIFSDITEEKRAQQALEASEEKFRKAFYTSTDSININRLEDGMYNSINPGFTSLMGYTEEETIGRTSIELNIWQNSEDRIQLINELKKHGHVSNFDATFLTKNGDVRHGLMSASVIELDGVPHILNITRDITDRKLAEQALRESRDLLDATERLAHIGGWAWDVERQTMAWTDGCYHIHGMNPGELAAGSPEHIDRSLACYDPADRPVIEAAFRRCAAEGRPYDLEFHLTRTDGHRIWIHTMGRAVKEGDRVIRVVGNIMDITARRLAEAELARARDFIEYVEDACFELDLRGNLTFHNEPFLRATGYSYDEYMALSRWDRHPTREEARRVFQIYEDVLQTGIPAKSVEYQSLHKDGTTTISEVSISLVRDPAGNPAGFRSVGRDITSRKRQQEALQASEERFRGVFEFSPTGIAIVDVASQRFVRANQSFLKIVGYTEDELAAKTVADITHPEDWESEQNTVKERIDGASDTFELEKRYVRKDGSLRWVQVTGDLLQSSPGELLAIANVHDITERRQAQDEVKNREYLLNKIFDVLPIGLWFADETGRLIRGNPAGVKIWGAEPTVPIEEYGVFKARRLPSGEELAPDDWALAHTIREGATILDELLEIDAFDGQKKIILNYTAPVLDDMGTIQGAIVVNQDISERERLNARLTQAQKMESIGQLAGGVAHDFNNMLGVIIGRVEMAMDEVDPAAPLFADLTEIRKAAQRSADLTGQLLAFARRQAIAPKVIDVNATVEGMLKMLRHLIGENIDLAWQPGTNLWPVMADPSQIDQILANLCVNARDAIAGVGKITITTQNSHVDEDDCAGHADFVPGEYLRISVSDSGCGIDRVTLEHIFEPFFTTKGVGKGTGLGLATVYGAVKQNSGFLDVTSEPGKGTTFTIYLPRHAGKDDQRQKGAAAETITHGRETILLVEDEPAVLDITAKMLKNLGYTVLKAGSPADAIRLAGEHQGEIHLLITDLVMPEMSGRELAEKLLSIYPMAGCLFMSGYSADVIGRQGVMDAGVHFLPKPFNKKALADKVREALHRG